MDLLQGSFRGVAQDKDLAQDKARISDRCLKDEARDSVRLANQNGYVLDWLVERGCWSRAEKLPQEI